MNMNMTAFDTPSVLMDAQREKDLLAQIRKLKRERRDWKRDAEYWRSLTHVSLGGKRV